MQDLRRVDVAEADESILSQEPRLDLLLAPFEEPGQGADGESTTSVTQSSMISGAGLVETDLDDGKLAMKRIFVDGNLVSADEFNRFWITPTGGVPGQIEDPFLKTLAEKGGVSSERATESQPPNPTRNPIMSSTPCPQFAGNGGLTIDVPRMCASARMGGDNLLRLLPANPRPQLFQVRTFRTHAL